MARNSTETAKDEQKEFFNVVVRTFLKNREIGAMTVDNGFGTILISRMPTNEITNAIGFGADWDDDESEYYDEWGQDNDNTN